MSSNSKKYINRQIKDSIYSPRHWDHMYSAYVPVFGWAAIIRNLLTQSILDGISRKLWFCLLCVLAFPGFVLGPRAKMMPAALTLQIFGALPDPNEVESGFLDCGEKAYQPTCDRSQEWWWCSLWNISTKGGIRLKEITYTADTFERAKP